MPGFLWKQNIIQSVLQKDRGLKDRGHCCGINCIWGGGKRRGDVVSICILTIPENYYLLYAANKIGSICNYVAVNNSIDEIKKRILSTNSKFVFTVNLVENNVVEAVGDNADIRIVSIPLSTSMPFPIALLVKAKSKKKPSERVSTWKDYMEGVHEMGCY